MWTGGRLGILGFGQLFYANDRAGQPGGEETTGNFVGPGAGLELDIGARLSHRYTPFLLFEHGFMGQGHRFAGTDARSSSDLLGLGFRLLAGDVNSVAFASELSVAQRVITVRNGGETYKMKGLELFRLGLGAEIRLSKLFTLTPMASIGGGTLTETEGNITYGAEGSKDGLRQPTFKNGENIEGTHQRSYVVLGLGCGAYFDVFGK